MSWSVSEVQALAKKAVRGKGYTWGEAEEVAQAVAWLEQRELPGASALAHCLDQCSAVGTCVAPANPHWSQEQNLAAAIYPHGDGSGCSAVAATCCCPLKTGIALMEAAAPQAVWDSRENDTAGEDDAVSRQLRTPLLLLPFLANATANHGDLEAPGLYLDITSGENQWQLWIGAGECFDTTATSGTTARRQAGVCWQALSTTAACTCTITGGLRPTNLTHLAPAAHPTRSPRVPDSRADAIAALERWAAHTYAPATEASRAAGAGAGLTDND